MGKSQLRLLRKIKAHFFPHKCLTQLQKSPRAAEEIGAKQKSLPQAAQQICALTDQGCSKDAAVQRKFGWLKGKRKHQGLLEMPGLEVFMFQGVVHWDKHTSACCSLTLFSKCSVLATAGGSLGGPVL